MGAVIGVTIAAPILVTFTDFLDFGYTAYHSGAANAYSYPRAKITSLALPYAVAPGGHLNPIFDGQAGYLTLPAVLVAIVGFGGKRGRAGQMFLGSVVVVLVLLWTVSACVALGLMFFRGKSSPKRAGTLAMLATAIVILDAAGTYAVPQLSASTRHAVDLAPVHYPQIHLGTSRFYTLGPIQPNYGSYWAIASINVDDLPVPTTYTSFLTGKLSPAPGTPGARGTKRSFLLTSSLR